MAVVNVAAFIQRPDNADLLRALDNTTRPIRDEIVARLTDVLGAIPMGGTDRLRYKGEINQNGKKWENPKITDEAMAKADALNQIILKENEYHLAGICEDNFELLVKALSAHLKAGRWDDAEKQVIECMRRRRTTNENSRLRPAETIHADYVRLLNALIHDLRLQRGVPGMQVGLYQYKTDNPSPKAKPSIYDMRVQTEAGHQIINTATPYSTPATAKDEVDGYNAIKDQRMQLGDSVVAGRRTRRRAFKRRPKQSRKRMSRRA